jgi:hypothetical protein
MWGWWSVSSVEVVISALPAPRQELTWEDAQVGPGIYQILLLGDAVRNEKADGAGSADISRR